MPREEIEKILHLLTAEAMDLYGERLMALAVFGSCARDTMRPDSDIDFLIVAEELPDGRMKRVREFEPVEEKLLPSLRPDLRGVAFTRACLLFSRPLRRSVREAHFSLT